MVPDILPTVPASKQSGDRITAHKIAILAIIKEFCAIKNRTKITGFEESPDRWVHTNKQNREMAIVLLKLIQSPDMKLMELDRIIRPIFHENTYEIFVDRLQRLRENGVAGIMDYIQAFEPLLVDPAPTVPVVQKSSVIGLFIRRMLLAFDKLTFSQVTKLCHKYYSYYDMAYGQLECQTQISDLDTKCERILDTSDGEEEDELLASQKQAEFFIAQQAALLQINENKALTPLDLRFKIRELLKGNPTLTEAHYLSFLNYLRVKEYCGTIENLYHHFDRNTSVPQETKAVPASEDSCRSFRYAALNLAIMHAKYGHRELALAALKEAIMVAQEVNDNICLQHALAWLYRLSPGSTDILVERSVSKSAELNLWYLSSLGIQTLSKMKCLTTLTPVSVFDFMMKGDILNCQHSMTEVMGSAYALRAALWTHYGNRCMADLVSQLLLHLNTADPARGGIYHIGEGTCIALRNLAVTFSSQGEFGNSTLILQLAHQLFPIHSEHSHLWRLCELNIAFKKALNTGKWVEAERTVAAIEILDTQTAKYRYAQLFLHQGNLTKSYELIREMIQECENTEVTPQFRVRVLLLKASLLCETPNYSEAIPPLMTCMDICKSHHLIYLGALTILYVAGIQLMLKLPEKAIHMLDNIFVNILAHGSQYHKGCCYMLYSKCLAASAQSEENATEKIKMKQSAISTCNTALDYFKKIQSIHKVKYCLCWMAHMHNQMGQTQERNSCSFDLKSFDQQYPSANWSGIMVP